MNEIIALPRLAEIVAGLASVDTTNAEIFIKAFFEHIEDSLAVSERVTVNGLGSFCRTTDPGMPIRFIPDSRLSDIINEPFDMFEPVAIGNTVLDDMPAEEAESTTEEPPATNEPQPDITPETAGEPVEAEPADTVCPDPEPAEPDAEPEIPAATDNDEQPEDDDIPQEYPEKHFEYQPKGHRTLYGLLLLLGGIAIGTAIGYFGKDHIDNVLADKSVKQNTAVTEMPSADDMTTPDTDSIVPENEDTVEICETPLEIKKTVVYDTISPTRFLTTMARKYYGKMEYWVFIYEANSDRLGNPNRIKPGTILIIPDEDDISADETPEQTLDRAKRLGREIYNRYE